MRTVTECSAIELAGAIRARELTATEVVDAHIDLHARLRSRLGAIASERFERARAEAQAADRKIATTLDPAELPPLLGVPFTVKESIAVRGMPHSAGLVARRAHRAERNACTVQRLIDAGAIVLGVTNTSELTMWIEAANRLYGRTNNPYDPTRTAGGSSGGEGAAVGSGASPFGLASDMAGSIRIPAFFCGVFGHKTTAGLVPNVGHWPPTTGDAARYLATGLLTRRAEDLMPLLRIIAGADERDPLARPTPLRDPRSVEIADLTVVTVENSSILPMNRELRDVRERVVGALVAAGARHRRVRLRSWRFAAWPFLATLQAGSATTTLALLEQAGATAPTWSSLLRRDGPHTLPTRLVLASELLPAAGRSHERLVAMGRSLADELVDAIGDGVLIHPPYPRAAPRHGSTTGRPWLLSSSAVFSLARVPVTEVPLGLSRGLPLGVQVAATQGRDDVTIAVALELERVFGGWRPPPALGSADGRAQDDSSPLRRAQSIVLRRVSRGLV